MTNLYQIINSLRATNSRLDKESILKQNVSNKELEKVFVLAYNQLTNYYLSTVNVTSTGDKDLDDEGFAILNKLSLRLVTGNAAIELATNYANSLNKESQDIFISIIEKDFKCGVTATTLKKIWKDNSAFKDFSVMLCDDFEKNADKVKYPVIVQLKYDASRVLIIVKDDLSITYMTRNGKQYHIRNKDLETHLIAMYKELSEYKSYYKPGVVFDGELYQLENGKILSRQISNGVATKLIRDTASDIEQSKVGITLWDCISLTTFESDSDCGYYTERYDHLHYCLQDETMRFIKIVENHIAYSEKEVYDIANEYIAKGEEGVIVKNPMGYYKRKRTKDCLKVKEIAECDLEIVGIIPGTGKYKGQVGSLMCKDKSGLYTVNVGSGLTDDLRKSISEKDIGKIVSIKYNMKIEDKDGIKSLFLPRFVEIREDKNEADVL